MHYAYVLLSKRDGKFYTGLTNDLKRRFQEHNSGNVESTMKRRPLDLVYYEACLVFDDAIAREKYLKSGMGKGYLRNRLQHYGFVTG
ncbi:MAG: GIY-YIG nuclease family protein [Deltaproteobacteria bacterium]|nr:GIY-YIG nuclease family protein [Deltaproteobacteria bacterium]MBW2154415.1 GIY-YIG nuclease family protein [Deltaproteobacteria bacterium]